MFHLATFIFGVSIWHCGGECPTTTRKGAHIDAVVQEQVGVDRVGFGVVIVGGSNIRAL
jgi:hypothetical protein